MRFLGFVWRRGGGVEAARRYKRELRVSEPPGNWRRVLRIWRCVGGFGVAGRGEGSHGDDEGRPPSGRSLLAAARGAGAVEVPESGAEKMHGFVRRDARSRRSAGWSRSRGPSGSARAVPGARRTSPASRAFGRFSRRQARSGPAPRTPGVRARWPAPAPGRSRCRPSMISSDFELDRCVTSPSRARPRVIQVNSEFWIGLR